MTFKIFASGGLGDTLLLTPALRALKLVHPHLRLEVLCPTQEHYDLLQRNPNVSDLRLMSETARVLEQATGKYESNNRSAPPPQYKRTNYSILRPMVTHRHATELIAEMLDVEVSDHRLEIFLGKEEEDYARSIMEKYRCPIALHITSGSSQNQNWSLEKWAALVRRNCYWTFIQLGRSHEDHVPGSIDFRGRTTIRESIALLKYARSFVGVVSSMAHATNAVGTAGVVLFGPSEVDVWAHENNINITKRLRCAPCIDLLYDTPCPYGAPCLSEISVEEVEAALREQLRRQRSDCAEFI